MALISSTVRTLGVRPLAGAGIEIFGVTCWPSNVIVRPLAGAGIEMTFNTPLYT